jgi:hypothetical protein
LVWLQCCSTSQHNNLNCCDSEYTCNWMMHMYY